MSRPARIAAYAGVAVGEYGVAVAYLSRGTWWHYLLHQLVGWGLGLAVGSLVRRQRRPGRPRRHQRPRQLSAVGAAVAGQLVAIAPDLIFRYLRMPHEPSMDLWVGHISIHRGPSPVLVALAVFLLGGWAWLAAAYGRQRVALALAVTGPVVLTVACLVALPIPSRLQDFPRDSAPVSR